MATDSPLSNAEIVKSAVKRRRPQSDDEESNWYTLSKSAKGNTACPVCGWQDGDGIKSCFYSVNLGAITHENTDFGAERSMTPGQISLFRLRHAFLYPTESARQSRIQTVAEEHKRKHWEWDNKPYTLDGRTAREYYSGTPFCSDEYGKERSDEDWIARYTLSQMREPTGDQEPYCHWLVTDKQSDVNSKLFYYEPHPDCGGKAVTVGPYHIRCSRCGTEVRMWEHGIDYDVG